MSVSLVHPISGRPVPCPRRGFTLIEAMISVAMLATIFSAVVAQWASLEAARRNVRDREIANGVFRLLQEKIAGAPWDSLMTTWSSQRLELANPPTWMGDEMITAILPNDRCIVRKAGATTVGLIDEPTGLENLRVFLEYYRAFSDPAVTEPAQYASINGLMDLVDIHRRDPASTDLTATQKKIAECMIDGDAKGLATTDLTLFRITNISQVGDGPVVVRLIVSFGPAETLVGPSRTVLQSLTARRR